MRRSAPTVTALAALALLLGGCAGGAPSDDMEEPMPSCSPGEMMSESEEPMDDESEEPMDDEAMTEEPMDDDKEMKDECEDEPAR